MSQHKSKDAGFHKSGIYDCAMSFSVRDEKLIEVKLNESHISDDENNTSSENGEKKTEGEETDTPPCTEKIKYDVNSEESIKGENSETVPHSSYERIIVYGEEFHVGPSEVKNGLRHRNKVHKLQFKQLPHDKHENDGLSSEKEEVESGVEASKHFEMEGQKEDTSFEAIAFSEIPGNSPDDDSGEGKLSKFLNFVFHWLYIIIAISIAFTHYFIGGILFCILMQLMWHRFVSSQNQSSLKKPFQVPDFGQLGPLSVPHPSDKEGVWFNEYTRPYDLDKYSLSKTVPVYMEIENSRLILSRPKGKVNKRALCEEPKYKLEFINRRTYDLRLCRVSLGPEGVFRRRFFNKKYPIVIELAPESLVKAVRLKETTGEEEEIEVEETYEGDAEDGAGYGRKYLNLFARCNRQKEEWYRRLRMATKVRPSKSEVDNGSSTPFEDLTFDLESMEYDEYWRFMSQYVVSGNPESIPAHPESDAQMKFAVEVQWLNALLSRIMYDVFRSAYWLSKIEAKIQRRLGSVRLPENIELDISEFDVGKVGPHIHRISQPYLDDRGVWIYMDVTFDGSFKMILQMHINRDKKQKGSEDENSERKEKTGENETTLPEKEAVKDEGKHRKFSRTRLTRGEVVSELTEKTSESQSIVEDEFFDANDFDPQNLESSESEEEEDDDDEDDAGHYEDSAEPGSSGGKSGAHSDNKRSLPRAGKYLWMMGPVEWNWKNLARNKSVRSLQKTIVKNFKLVVEVKSFVGTLAINLPPPPCDRIWFGFLSVPKLSMSAYPKVGELDIQFSSVKNYIEKRIMREVKKVIVIPNMEDILLPVPPDGGLLSRISGHGDSPGMKAS